MGEDNEKRGLLIGERIARYIQAQAIEMMRFRKYYIQHMSDGAKREYSSDIQGALNILEIEHSRFAEVINGRMIEQEEEETDGQIDV